MLEAAELIKAYERNTKIIEFHGDGLSHEDSLAQTEFNINCFNWTVGHIVWYRDILLKYLGHSEQTIPAGRAERYAQESEPIVEDGPDVIPFAELLGYARDSQNRLADVLGEMTPSDFAEERTEEDRTRTVASVVHFNYFHDTYHAGQTEILRQVAGVSDV